jgi:2-polyprenyl-6-methoxyphenol hydroxylase-like FAD-dependent oxidoreductase
VADVLVGADGVGSAVRRAYLPRVRVADTGLRMLMGATPLQALADTGLAEMIGDNPGSVQTDGVMMALAALRYDQSPVVARDQWLPTLRSPAVDDAEDYVMWAMLTSKQRIGQAKSPAAITDVARGLTVAAHPTLRLMLDEAWPHVTFPHRIGMIPPTPLWPTSPVTLIGDAIHVAPGFGGNLAMHDAHCLRDALLRADRGEQDLLAAIGAYEEAMRSENFPARFTLRWLRTRLFLSLARRGGARVALSFAQGRGGRFLLSLSRRRSAD